MIGQTIGEYRITEKLFEGGFGIVYKATELSLDRVVALKTMDAALAQDAKFKVRFFAEAKVQAKLVHPNIVTIYRFFEHDDRYFIAMEYLEGMELPGGSRARTLSDLVRLGPMLEDRIALVFNEVLDAVACAHKHSVLHRDIKPLNVLFAESGLGKVADFGIAKIVGGETSVSVSGTRVGTSGYMSPEQVLNRPLDRRSDIYALGVTLYEMATGQLPFKATSTTSMEEQHLFQPPPPVQEVNPSVSAELAGIITRALAKKPEDRFQTCEELASALRHFCVGDQPSSVPRQVEVPSVLGRFRPDAEQAMELAGLKLEVEGDDFSETVPAGKAVRQTPAPGSLCRAGSTVMVVISRGRQPTSLDRTQPELQEQEHATSPKSVSRRGLVASFVFGVSVVVVGVLIWAIARKVPGSRVPMHQLAASHADASSFCTTGSNAPYTPSNAIDGKPYTCWTEKDGEPRIGQFVRVYLPAKSRIGRIGIRGGYERVHPQYGDVFSLNNRLRTAELQFSEGTVQEISLDDVKGTQYFDIKPSVAADWVKLTVTGYYPGSKWDDMCISEIELWGY